MLSRHPALLIDPDSMAAGERRGDQRHARLPPGGFKGGFPLRCASAATELPSGPIPFDQLASLGTFVDRLIHD